MEEYVAYLWNKYLWKNMWNICGSNISGRLCGIFEEQIFMEECVEYLRKNMLNICGTNIYERSY